MKTKWVAVKKKTGESVDVPVVTVSAVHEIREIEEEFGGMCFRCGTIAFGVEPDASRYECESCGGYSVYGLELAMLHGRLIFETPELSYGDSDV